MRGQKIIGYVEVIASSYPGVKVKANGYGDVYEDLIHLGGDPIPAKTELDTKMLELKQSIIWEDIKTKRELRLASGFYCEGKGWHSDNESRIKYLGLLMLGTNMPTTIYWKTMDGSFVQMTPTLIGQIFNALAAWDTSTFTKAEEHKAAMIQSADPFAYDYSEGWPLIYGEQ